MKCKICNTINSTCFNAKILSKYEINYYHCVACGFLQTQAPFWLEEAYARSINVSDTGYMARNILFSNKLTILLYLLFGKSGCYSDFAGGYGVFVRMMRDIGFNFYWEDKYTDNLFAAGFERGSISEIDAITVFESFEHFEDPVTEIKALLDTSGTVIFSTELYPDSSPGPEDWWYFGLDHGQHISFYSEKTLRYIADKSGVNYYRAGLLHILTIKHIPKWKLLAMKLSRYGLHCLISKRLSSKTWDDYTKIVKMGSK